jgi:hypothetical protein
MTSTLLSIRNGTWIGVAAAAALSCGSGGSAPPGEYPDHVRTFDVAPGTCGVSREITLAADGFEIDRVVRSAAGFAAPGRDPASAELRWLSVSVDGSRQRLRTSAGYDATNVVVALPFSESADVIHPVAVTAARDQPNYLVPLHAQPLDPPGSEREIGAYFARGTTSFASASSLDGKRGLFAAEHPVTFPPHVVLFDATGAISGSELVLDNGNVTCLAATPTASSAAVGVVYTDASPTARILELGADGSVVVNASVPSSVLHCPFVQSGGRSPGSVLVVTAAADDTLQIYVFPEGVATAQISAPPSLGALGSMPRWLARLDDGSFALLVPKDGRFRLARLTPAGDVTWIPADLPGADVIPGAPGELFLHVSDAGQTGPRTHRIAQVTCNGVGFGT